MDRRRVPGTLTRLPNPAEPGPGLAPRAGPGSIVDGLGYVRVQRWASVPLQ
ncbi:hypothetical protein ACWCYY_18920 [Kitasatospora sp. NPDC001664]|uniref:hypothetical protein n=1 Tax=Kitasatospora albolonga TaxID=68173 RepID=UPI0031E52A54